MPAITEHRTDVGGTEVFWRRAEPEPGAPTTLYVHGVPTSSDDWLPFLERTGGVALDLPGFGRSAKPAAFDYSIRGYDRFLEAFLAEIGLQRFALLVHDWGSVALATAQRMPERIERLVVMNAVPLLEGYRWHRIARAWRTPVVGELVMGFSSRRTLKLLSREAWRSPGAMPEGFIDAVMEHFDHGTQRAILKLYRSSPPEVLAQAGAGLGALGPRTLVLWGRADPYVPAKFAQAFADALGGEAEVELLDAGHWPWIDRPEVVGRVAQFLALQGTTGR